VAEEANHRGIYFSVHKSNEMRLICKGKGSFFIASYGAGTISTPSSWPYIPGKQSS
jgi:hypothetical protein